MNGEFITTIKTKLKLNLRIILFDNQNAYWLRSFENELLKRNISHVEILHNIDSISTCGMVKFITQEEMNEVLELYRTYDFSDKVIVISESEQYGGMLNYVKNGLLTEEEMVEAFISKV